ncbi:RNA-directed DNA polymerase-like protein [Cucumis melo var. makuwa]|uniref:RNA-directed DNA polymerase-like protein n=1 Tax=Cucumis melo var. makuwa TaxID=1194695 RepID=A0A5D3C7V0_CUCMM|nr:RNA-directed DNA polymerase-like protein [Cucumis melo var. makuwa]
MKAMNSVALSIIGLVKRKVIKLEGWKGPADFVVVKMDDFDVVLGMEFLLKHQEPPSVAILLGASGKLGEIVPKDTLCVLEKCHGVMPNSWPKSLSMRTMIDHGIELLPEAKAPVKNTYCMVPPKLAKLRKPSKKLLPTGFSRSVRAPYGAPVLFQKKKDRNPQQCIKRCILNKLTDSHKYPIPILPNLFDRSRGVKYFPKSDIRLRYCRVRATKAEGLETTCVIDRLRAFEFPLEPRVSGLFDGLKQATIEGPSLRVTDATKPSKIEFGHDAQTDSLIRRSQFVMDGSRHSILPSITDGPYVRNSPQVHKVEKEWEQMADIARVCLEKASRPMEERVDQKQCPFEFEWSTKFLINGATMPYSYLSTWKRKKIEKSRKSLLTK